MSANPTAEPPEEEELRTAYYQPGGKPVEDDEEEVRTKYYQAGDGAPKRLPTFEEMAADEAKAAGAPNAPVAALQPPPAAMPNQPAPVPSQAGPSMQYAATLPAIRHAATLPSMQGPQASAGPVARDATQPAMRLPANAPQFTTQPRKAAIPWGKLAVMALVGAFVGLFFVVALAFVLRAMGR